MDSITVRFEYTPDDYAEGRIAADCYFTKRRRQFSKSSFLAFTFATIAGGLWMALSAHDHVALIGGIATLFLGLLSAGGLSAIFWKHRFGLRREFASLGQWHGTWEMQFAETGVHTQSLLVASDISWEWFKKFAETNSFYLLSHPPNSVIIPKRVFDPEQQRAFRKLLEKKLPIAECPRKARGFLFTLAATIMMVFILYFVLLVVSR